MIHLKLAAFGISWNYILYVFRIDPEAAGGAAIRRCCIVDPDSGAFFLNPLFGHQAGKMIECSIIGAFSIIWKTACRQLPAAQMIAQTLTTISFARTGFITAVTFFKVFFSFTFHVILLCWEIKTMVRFQRLNGNPSEMSLIISSSLARLPVERKSLTNVNFNWTVFV